MFLLVLGLENVIKVIIKCKEQYIPGPRSIVRLKEIPNIPLGDLKNGGSQGAESSAIERTALIG